MTELDWGHFEQLPGDQSANFELLWRGAVRHTYAKYGTFHARAQQPGVEFHLKLDRDCALGDAGEWFGWQTKWWPTLAQGKPLGVNRKKDIEDSLKKTQIHVPGITHWVLCTRLSFAPTDNSWWTGLSSPFELDHQVAEDLANLLTGDSELFRQTYFGDLILTPDRLDRLYGQAIADVRERWFPDVHFSGPAEHSLRRMLAEPEAWSHLKTVGSEMLSLAAVIDEAITVSPLEQALHDELEELLCNAETIRQLLLHAHEHLTPGGDRTWRELGETIVPPPPVMAPPILRKLRAANHPAALACTNFIFHTREAAAIAKSVFGELATRYVTVSGDAGYGKTQLSARIAGASESRPAGVLLYGRQLRSRDSLDDLAARVSISGKKVETFEALLAAVDAAAARAQCRLPIVIDGLNEAEDPGEWKSLLERASLMLEDYPSVLLVCTLRSSFVPHSIPESLKGSFVELDGFGEDVDEAISGYFDYFNIDAGGVDLPRERFNHPIELRIFCTVTNPTRERRVQLTGRALSLNAMFDSYLADAAQRIEKLHPSRIRAKDVHDALRALGLELWVTRSREVSETRAKELIGDAHRRWDDSILNALQEEGILIRQTSQPAQRYREEPLPRLEPDVYGALSVAVVYDLLAGHIIASALAGTGGAKFVASLGEAEVAAKFNGEDGEVHPLAVDTFDALVFVLPQRGLGQLWQHIGGNLRHAALVRTTELDADEVDAETVAAWAENLSDLSRLPGFWPRLRSVRAVPNHPFNAMFTDSVLRSLSIASRDLAWTEWLRASTDPFRRLDQKADARALDDLHLWTARWRDSEARGESDLLRARWFMWMLTSTVRDLRDAATAALYWFGRGDATGLFELAAGSLEIDDPYVSERMTAAAYGLATAHQQEEPVFGAQLGQYIEQVLAATAGDSPTAPTFHRLTRYYIAGTVHFGLAHYSNAMPAAVLNGIEFADAQLPAPISEGDDRRDEVRLTIHSDFGNYTVGRLFKDRSNYDSDHPGHRDAIDQILGVVYALGWRMDEFAELDRTLANQAERRNLGRVDRYGKKYSWIGLQFVTGMMNARGDRVYQLEFDIDPTFPQSSVPLRLEVPTWVHAEPADDESWLKNGTVDIHEDLLYSESLDGDKGPWVLVHAELTANDEHEGRGGFGLFNTVAISASEFGELMNWWSERDHPGRDLIDLPSAYNLFAGEIPWHVRMVTSGDDIAGSGMSPIERQRRDGWVDAHEVEDPYFDRLITQLPKGKSILGDASQELDYLGILEKMAAGRDAVPSHLEIEFESLAHAFAWEAHNSSENVAFAYVPNRRMSQGSGLSSVASGFDQVDANGQPAAKSYSAPEGFTGHLLYIREDIIKAYANGRTVVTVGWGQRELNATWPATIPENLARVYRAHQNIWRTHRIASSDW